MFTTHPLGRCATCKRLFYIKNEYNIFYYYKLDAEYFFIQQIFQKKNNIFQKNCEKLFAGHIWPFFRKSRRLGPKINIDFFYHKLGTEYFIV